RMLGKPDRYRMLFGRGMVSDDTEHACIVAQSLIGSRGDDLLFARELGKRLRWWFLSIPAGIGLASARASIKLLLGFPPGKSGVYSAGNGPCMRTPILGAAIDDLETLRRLVRISTRITHTDPKAEHGAWVVSLAARFARQHEHPNPNDFVCHLRDLINEPDAA